MVDFGKAMTRSPGEEWDRGCVLVADDEPLNRKLLRELLRICGHEVMEASDGVEVVDLVRRTPPDVILMDVVMPRMTGLEACRILKGDPSLARIPVLLVTAQSAPEDRLAGMEAGADDFLPKPFDTRVAMLRVRNAVRAKKLHEQVIQDVASLKALERLKENLGQMIVHDLRGPLTGIAGYLELLERRTDGSEAAAKLLQAAGDCTDRLLRMVSDLLDVSRLEEGKLPLVVRRANVVELALQTRSLLGQANRIQVSTEPGLEPIVPCDADLIGRVIGNLVGNALKFSPSERLVEVSIKNGQGRVRIEVRDQGHGIAPEYLDRVFDKFAQVEARQAGHYHSSGLGLTFCKLAVEAHHGRIGVQSEEGRGSTFWFELPAPHTAGVRV
jgi:two-component system, sensor histidine kinase and response regulator